MMPWLQALFRTRPLSEMRRELPRVTGLVGGQMLLAAGGVTVGFTLGTVETQDLFISIALALCSGYTMGSGGRLCGRALGPVLGAVPPRSTPPRWPWDWLVSLLVLPTGVSVWFWYAIGPLAALVGAVMGIGMGVASLASYDRAPSDGQEAPAGPGSTLSGADVPS
jgi:hypothetical protein